jgi:hypothetical protein
VNNDFVTIIGTGNSVEHAIINKALDGWFRETFTGTVTITPYPPSSSATVTGSPDNPTVRLGVGASTVTASRNVGLPWRNSWSPDLGAVMAAAAMSLATWRTVSARRPL